MLWRSQASRTESRYAEAEEARRTHLPTLTFYPLTLFTHCITHFVLLPTTAKIVERKVKESEVKRRKVSERNVSEGKRKNVKRRSVKERGH